MKFHRFIALTVLLSPVVCCFPSDDEPKQSYTVWPSWQLVDIGWDTGEERPFDSCSIDITINADVPEDSELLIVPICGHLSNTLFSCGFASKIRGAFTKEDRLPLTIGPGMIFSRWGELSLDAVRPSVKGYCFSGDQEGKHVSVRPPFVWGKGKYTVKLVNMDKERIGDRPYRWVGGFVYSHEKDENFFVGGLRFEGESLKLTKRPASFVAVFGEKEQGLVEKIPRLEIRLENLKVNNELVKPPLVMAHYEKDTPDYADAKLSGGAIVIKVGEKVEGRKERVVTLIGDPEKLVPQPAKEKK